MSKPVLALDSALGGCIVALVDGERVHSRVLETSRDQAAKLMPMVQQVMDEAGVSFDALGLIVTTTGPGSFTGLRIGLSAARALGLALSIPVQGVSTFDAMVKSCAPKGPSVVVLESKRADFYTQAYDDRHEAVGAPACLLSDAIPPDAVICGDGVARLRVETGLSFENAIERSLADPVILAGIGVRLFAQNGGAAHRPEPFYMRGADVSLSGKAQRQIKDFPA